MRKLVRKAAKGKKAGEKGAKDVQTSKKSAKGAMAGEKGEKVGEKVQKM